MCELLLQYGPIKSQDYFSDIMLLLGYVTLYLYTSHVRVSESSRLRTQVETSWIISFLLKVSLVHKIRYWAMMGIIQLKHIINGSIDYHISCGPDWLNFLSLWVMRHSSKDYNIIKNFKLSDICYVRNSSKDNWPWHREIISERFY